MADKPILFSSPMIKALLGNRKTQTRRAITDVPAAPKDGGYIDSYCSERKTAANPRGMSTAWCWWTPDNRMGRDFKVKCAPGDRLWVREACAQSAATGEFFYRSDWGECGQPWKPSIHMPRWASRLTLTVTDVRVQRLQEISEEDAIAEGLERDKFGFKSYSLGHAYHLDARGSFASLWLSINGVGSWDANPWVAAYTFTVEQRNIDA